MVIYEKGEQDEIHVLFFMQIRDEIQVARPSWMFWVH